MKANLFNTTVIRSARSIKQAFVLGTLVVISASSTALAKPAQMCPDGFIPSPSPAVKCQPENLTAEPPNTQKPIQPNRPDLKIRQYKFTPIGRKHVRVQVANYGKLAARPNVLQMTVREINGTAVARRVQVKVPMLKGGESQWILVDAKSILPQSVALQQTKFRLDADATDRVSERNENNNTAWHNG